MSLSRPNYRTNGPVNGLVKVKSPGLVTPCSNGVEARGCEQLAQSRYAAASWPGLNSRPLDHKSDTLPLRHHATPVNVLVHRPAIYTVGPLTHSPSVSPSTSLSVGRPTVSFNATSSFVICSTQNCSCAAEFVDRRRATGVQAFVKYQY